MKKTIIPILIIFFISFFVYLNMHEINRIKQLNIEYRNVLISDNFSKKITGLYTEKGYSFVVLDNSLKISFETSRNYEYSGKNRHLSHMLSIGDTLIKKRGTLDLIVKKKDKEYHFVIGKFINKEKDN